MPHRHEIREVAVRGCKGWIKANPMSSSSTNWCCGISPQGQELRHVEAEDAAIKGAWKKCSEKWENGENFWRTHIHTHKTTTKLSRGMQLCDVWLLWYHSCTVWLKSCTLVSGPLSLCLWGFPLLLPFLKRIFLPPVVSSMPDVDECGALTQPCSPGFNCINTMGSYICNRKITCSRGYHASPDGSRCVGKIRIETHRKQTTLHVQT